MTQERTRERVNKKLQTSNFKLQGSVKNRGAVVLDRSRLRTHLRFGTSPRFGACGRCCGRGRPHSAGGAEIQARTELFVLRSGLCAEDEAGFWFVQAEFDAGGILVGTNESFHAGMKHG